MEHSCRYSENGFVTNSHLAGQAGEAKEFKAQSSRFSIADIAQLRSTGDADVNASGLKSAGMEMLASGTSVFIELLKQVDRGRCAVSGALSKFAALVQGQGARPQDPNELLASKFL